MENEVKNTASEGASEYHRLNREAKALGIDTTRMKMQDIVVAIAEKHNATMTDPAQPLSEFDKLAKDAQDIGINIEGMDKDAIVKAVQRKQINENMRIEAEEREKIRQEYRLKQERAELLAESEAAAILIELPDPCTDVDLAKARRKLGIEKKKVKPSPETLAIEASPKNYYIFRNLEQDDVDIVCYPGGKYRFELIAGELHVLPAYLLKYMRLRATVPIYKRIAVKNAQGEKIGESTVKTGDKPRFTFELIAEAPQDAPFGLVTDESLKAKLLQKEVV